MDYRDKPPLGLPQHRGNGAVSAAPDPGVPMSASPSGGFDAGAVWDGHYTLRPYADAEGDIPVPTQERIDDFRRKMGKFVVDLQKAADEQAKARRKAEEEQAKDPTYGENFDAERAMADLEQAIAEERRIYGEMRDHVAAFCKGKPTRKQLEKLPDVVFLKFADFVGGLINPEA